MIPADPKLPLISGVRTREPVSWIKEFVARFYALWRELGRELQSIRGESESGTYSPTLTSVANLSGNHTVTDCQYLRVGKTVVVSGKCTVATITAATTLTKLRVSLPISSALAQDYELAGTLGNAAFDPGYIKADAANDEAEFNWYPGGTASSSKIVWFHFVYLVL